MIRIFEIIKDGAKSTQTQIANVDDLTHIPRKDERIYIQLTKLHYKVKSVVHDIGNDSIDLYVEQ